MIAKNEMMPLLLSVCPSFTDEWRKFLDDHKDHADPPLYIALGDLARHLVGMLERNDVVSLQAVFRAVEQLHVEGDDYVREAATIGLLEDLQNQISFRLSDHVVEPR